MRRARRRSGQSVTEYILTVSVLVIAIVAAVYDPVRLAVESASEDLSKKVTDGTNRGGYGLYEDCGPNCQR